MTRTKRDTIESMGLEAFLNRHYGTDAYKKYTVMVVQPDSEIAKAFGTPERPLHYQTVANWRRAYLAEANR